MERNLKKICKKKNSLQCFSRYKRIRPGIIRGSWRKEEDIKILEMVRVYGKSWSKISKLLGTRNGKQIRDRFLNVLDPDMKKGKFTEEEDRKLLILFKQFGPKWATISKYYSNRTADMIKNRFHSSIKKKVEDEEKEGEIKEDIVKFSSLTKESSSDSISSNEKMNSANSYTESCAMKEIEDLYSRNFNSNFGSDISDSDFYSEHTHYNYEIGANEKENINQNFNWKFEDFLAI